jgi:hypothetical protein
VEVGIVGINVPERDERHGTEADDRLRDLLAVDPVTSLPPMSIRSGEPSPRWRPAAPMSA